MPEIGRYCNGTCARGSGQERSQLEPDEEPADSELLDQNGAGVEQIEAPALHVLLGLGPRLRGDYARAR